MWSGRLAGQSSTSPAPSQPGSRSYSPVPRRSTSGLGPYITSQQRPGISPRASSLSLVSNDSSTSNSSFLASSRKVNGSALKQSTTAYAGPDPVDVLNKLLGNGDEAAVESGRPSASAASTLPSPSPSSTITPSDLELDFDFGGMSLRELALSEDPVAEGTYVHRSQTVEECMSASLPRPLNAPLIAVA